MGAPREMCIPSSWLSYLNVRETPYSVQKTAGVVSSLHCPYTEKSSLSGAQRTTERLRARSDLLSK